MSGVYEAQALVVTLDPSSARGSPPHAAVVP